MIEDLAGVHHELQGAQWEICQMGRAGGAPHSVSSRPRAGTVAPGGDVATADHWRRATKPLLRCMDPGVRRDDTSVLVRMSACRVDWRQCQLALPIGCSSSRFSSPVAFRSVSSRPRAGTHNYRPSFATIGNFKACHKQLLRSIGPAQGRDDSIIYFRRHAPNSLRRSDPRAAASARRSPCRHSSAGCAPPGSQRAS